MLAQVAVQFVESSSKARQKLVEKARRTNDDRRRFHPSRQGRDPLTEVFEWPCRRRSRWTPAMPAVKVEARVPPTGRPAGGEAGGTEAEAEEARMNRNTNLNPMNPTPWQLSRQAWSRPTSDIHALRRAWGRAIYNRRRRQFMLWRRRLLIALLAQYDAPCGDSLIGIGGHWLYERYWRETGASRRTFYRDLAAVRRLYENHYPDGPERGTCACTAFGRSVTLQSDAAAEAADTAARRPSPTAWQWRRQYVAVRLAVERTLPAEMAEVVLVHARRILAQLQFQWRGPQPQQGPPQGPYRRQAGTPARAGGTPRDAGGVSDPEPGLDGAGVERYVWRV
jgi:hypothetical protein